MITFFNKYSLAYLVIFVSAIYLSASVQARTVLVKDIARPPQSQDTHVLDISSKETSSLFTKTNTTFSVTLEPLITTPTSLLPITRTSLDTNYKPNEIYAWLQTEAKKHATAPEDARFTEKNGRVVEFNPGKTGLVPDLRKSSVLLLQNLGNKTTTSNLVGIIEEPRTKLADTNSLGISELIAGGISDFSGSSKNRRANIDAGSKKVRGVLVAPGETFSFNKYLGDVTAADGFKPEIVIKADGLKPELGGGICQVSSTLFRAAMQAGLPIITRKNHAFSVSHYFPAGTDATVYSPYTDLKFTNDTPAHILIWPYYSGENTLMFDLYGTRDDREVRLEEPVQWDRKADGSLKASWTRHVTKGGETRDDIIKSNYLPPALFKKEETFVNATPATPPDTSPTNSPTPSQ